MLRKTLIPLAAVALFPVTAFASSADHKEDIVHLMVNFVIQIGVIIFAARFGGMVFEKLKMPAVIGELVVGIIIGPYMLGSTPLPGFQHGIFPIIELAQIPVSQELYGIATLASVILLFMTGLETDLPLFLRYSVAGLVVGVGGVLFSFAIGAGTAMLMMGTGFTDPRCLFLGIMSTATSVGITARILSECKKIDSPEGVTILAGAVIDDVLGIILLAIVLGVTGTLGEGSQFSWGIVGFIAFKAVGVWIGFTVVGFYFANKISKFLKSFRDLKTISVMAFGMALILSGIFEKAGLAMIIGAYVMGLVLSKTDINYAIQETLHPLYTFFVPIFFTIMGMLVNVREMASAEVLIFGLVYTVGAVFAKVVGSGVPVLLMGFNPLGAIRIGLGMVPRGEVALIMAGIGLSHGILDGSTFGVAIMMTLVTTIVAPPLLHTTLRIPRRGTKKEEEKSESIELPFDFGTPELTHMMTSKLIDRFRDGGFFIHCLETDNEIFHIKKDTTFITLFSKTKDVVFEADEKDITMIETMVYQTLIEVDRVIDKIKISTRLRGSEKRSKLKLNLADMLDPACILLDMKALNKKDAITELADLLCQRGIVSDKNEILNKIWEYENIVAATVESDITTPYCRIPGVDKIVLAVGVKRERIDPSVECELCNHVVIMIVAPMKEEQSNIQYLAGITALFNKPEVREMLLSNVNRETLHKYVTSL